MTVVKRMVRVFPFILAAIVTCSAVEAGVPCRLAVVIGPDAGTLEQYAAEQLCGYCDKLYGI
ncbi:MAG: hypothetical protein ACC645_26860, partial [Pirellulales bacterium]